jgi:hypothetical protein
VVGESLKFKSDQKTLLGLKASSHSTLEIIKELFFTSRKTLYVIYREVCTGNSLDRDGFSKLIKKYSNSVISPEDSALAFE